ncbi:MAG: hypothetical protein ACYCOR_10665 [Acidobacteriaceae bacterium]
MTKEQIAAIEKRLREATTKDVNIDRYSHGGARLAVLGVREKNYFGRHLIADFYDEANREFYINAPADLAALLEERKALIGLLTDAIAESDGIRHGPSDELMVRVKGVLGE